MSEKFIVKCQMLRDSEFQVHLSSTKAMFQYMTNVLEPPVMAFLNLFLGWVQMSLGCLLIASKQFILFKASNATS